MTDTRNAIADAERPLVYQLRVQGHLGPQWADWFEGLTVTPTDSGETLITGQIADQAALHGVLKQVRDLGLPLISVMRVETTRSAK